MHLPSSVRPLLAAVALAACSKSGGPSATCGIAALTGPLVVMNSFGKGNSLVTPPDSVPETLPVRLVAGPLVHGLVAKDASKGWVIGIEGQIPATARPGYGVLIVDFKGISHGILMFDGIAVPGAPELGTVSLRDTVLPLLGVRLDPRTIEDPKCPVFPDSVR